MVGKIYIKDTWRLFKKNFIRFVVIMLLVALSIALVTGIGSIAPQMRAAADLAELQGVMEYAKIMEVRAMADKIELLSYIFPSFFITVAVLVIFTTITRFVEKERNSIGCLKTLGFSRGYIMVKYVLFAVLAVAAGSGLGLIIGHYVILPVLYSVIADFNNLPETTAGLPLFGFLSVVVTIGLVLIVTVAVIYMSVKEKPAQLLTVKAPKPGGKILLEKIPFFWKRLKFKYKSTMRNIFRYKVRFIMTVFCVLGGTALVFVGMALYFSLTLGPDKMDSIIPISVTVIVCAVILNVLVLYNITNINIEERKREIATLRVLGYRQDEVCGYVFRELFFLTAIGVLIGLPTGYFFMDFIFEYLKFGGIQYIKWYVWLITAGLSLASLAVADVFLFRKIHKIDMNGSLKVTE